MPVMRRSEIIEKYGFDPLKQDESGGASVVPKGTDTEPVTVGDPEKPTLQETGSASAVDNLQAGAVKSVLSDPLMIFGLAVGATDYALGKLGVTEDGSFEEQLFVDGGAEQVKQHIQEKATSLRNEHPDWSREKILGEVDRYRLTEDFFNYTTDRMKPGLSKGLKNALWVNKETGVNKLPTQETTADSVMQAIGGLALPMPPIADLAGRALGRIGSNAAVRALDALVTPGTRVTNYGVRSVGEGVGVNLGVDQVQRYAQGDPNLIREDALWDFSKRHMQLPREVDGQVPPEGSIPTSQTGTPESSGNIFEDAWNISDTAKAGATIAGAMGAGVAARSLVRRFRPNVPTPGNLERSGPNVELSPDPQGLREQSIQQMQQRGFEVPEARRTLEPIVQDLLPDEIAGTEIARRARIPTANEIGDSVDAAINRDAPITQAARDIGGLDLERDVDAIVGTIMAPHARASGANNFFESGVLPDGSRASTRPKDFVSLAQSMDEADVQDFVRGNLARNELDARDDVLNYSSDRYIAALNNRRQYQGTNQGQIQRLDQAVADERARMQEHFNDTENTRHAFTEVPSQDLRQHVAAQEANPRAMQLEQTLRRLNTDLVNFERRAGLISQQTAVQRLQRPWHSSLFQRERKSPAQWLANSTPDATRARSTEYEFNVPRNTVEKSIDAFSSFGARASAAIDRGQYVIGARRILNRMRAADPQGRIVQYRGPQHALGDRAPPPERSIVVPVRGVDHVWEVNSPQLATAFRQQPIDLGLSMGIMNRLRKITQFGFTGPLSPNAPATALRSLGFDMATAFIARPEGRSFGLVGSTLRRLTGATDPNSTLSRFIDKVEALDPTAPVQVLTALAQTPLWKTWGKMGQAFMDAAITHNGVFGQIARLPGGEQFLRTTGAQMWRAFESTPIGLMHRFNAFNPHAQLVDSWNARVRTDQIITRWANAGRDGPAITHAGKILYGAWQGVLDNVHNAAKVAFFAQNYAALEARYGRGRIPVNEVRRLANDSRNLSGDMQAVPGNALVAKGSAAIPYFNLMIQATRYIVNSAFNQGTNQSMNVAMRIGGMASAMYASYQMMEEMGLTDYMYEKMNDWDRIGHVFVPTAENIIHKARTGSYYKPDVANGEDPKKYFYRVKLAPEIATVVAPFIAGMESLGLINRGRNLSNSSIPKDIRATIMSHIGSANIPGISLAFQMTGAGNSVDFLRAGEGRGIVQSAPMLKGMGINADQTPGGIPTFATELATTIFGTTGSMLTTGLDAGMKANAGGAALTESLGAVKEQIGSTYQAALPSVPGLWKAEEKVYTTSPIGNRVYDTQAMMKALNSQWSLEFGKNAGQRPDANRIQDPLVRRMVNEAHTFFERGAYPAMEKRINKVRTRIDNLALTNKNTQEIAQEKRTLIMELQAYQERLVDLRGRFEQRLTRYGERFDQEKVPPTLEGLVELTKKYSSPAVRRPAGP